MNEDAIVRKRQLYKEELQATKKKNSESMLLRKSSMHLATVALYKVEEGYEFSQKIVIYDRKSLYLFHH
jgi:hypothetical protein